MSQFESTFGVPDAVAQKTSGLAIASLVCSLIVCCPITTLIGPFLGLAAIVSISNNPARKGKGIAFAGILIGLVVTILWGMGVVWGYKAFSLPVQQGPREAMQAGFVGDIVGFKSGLLGKAAVASDADAQAFIDELRNRYGEFVSCRLDEDEMAKNPPSVEEIMQPVKPFPYVFEFASKTVKADVEFGSFDPETREFHWGVKFGRFTIHDPDLGDLTYPPVVKSGGEGSEDADEDGAAEGDPETGDGD